MVGITAFLAGGERQVGRGGLCREDGVSVVFSLVALPALSPYRPSAESMRAVSSLAGILSVSEVPPTVLCGPIQGRDACAQVTAACLKESRLTFLSCSCHSLPFFFVPFPLCYSHWLQWGHVICVCMNVYVYELLYGKKLENQMRLVFSYLHKSSVHDLSRAGNRPSTHWTGGSVGKNPPAMQEMWV